MPNDHLAECKKLLEWLIGEASRYENRAINSYSEYLGGRERLRAEAGASAFMGRCHLRPDRGTRNLANPPDME